MKKIILVFALTILLFCSCKNEYGILSYQENDIEANCTVNGKYNVDIIKSGDFLSLAVNSPDNIAGVSFEIKGNEAHIIKDEIKIPIGVSEIKGIYSLVNMFSLNEEAITTATGNGVITFDTEYGIYTVTYGENNLPQHMEIDGEGFDYSVEIVTIRLKNE